MDREILNKYFSFINMKLFCETYDIWYIHFTEVLAGKQKMGTKLDQKIQTGILNFHDDLMEMSETIMQKPKKQNKRKSKNLLQSEK